VKISEGVRLFVLDDGGVLFACATQELCLLNTSATFIWCCVEDGLNAAQIAAAYAGGFEVAFAEAERHVADALAQWQGLGYVDGDVVSAGSEQPLLHALARLLVHEDLRIEFERSPHRSALRLRIAPDELAEFVALDPRALGQQAQALREYQAGARRRTGAIHATVFSTVQRDGTSALAAVAAAALRLPSASAITRRCRMLETTFTLRFASDAQARAVMPVLAHLTCDGPEPSDVDLDFLEIDEGHVMLVDGVPADRCREIDALAPLVKSRFRRMSVDRHRFLLEVHAGVVAVDGACLLLPGAPGQGKTTLTAALCRADFRYFSDEVALLELPNLAVRPMPLSLGIKPGAVEVLASRYEAIRDLPVHAREDEQRVRYLNPDVHPDDLRAALPVRWIVFPSYAPDAVTRLSPISRAQGLRRLMDECVVLPQLLDECQVQAMVQWLRGVECFELPLNSLDVAVDLVRQHCFKSAKDALRASVPEYE
jgi:Coenzyme PQQ synthesis protein D (PqqD)